MKVMRMEKRSYDNKIKLKEKEVIQFQGYLHVLILLFEC